VETYLYSVCQWQYHVTLLTLTSQTPARWSFVLHDYTFWKMQWWLLRYDICNKYSETPHIGYQSPDCLSHFLFEGSLDQIATLRMTVLWGIFTIFLRSCRRNAAILPQIKIHDLFLPHFFQFIIHQPTDNFTRFILGREKYLFRKLQIK
jgi:hypothetical protein